MSEWKKYSLGKFAEINPRVSLKQGNEYSFVEMKDLDAMHKYVSPSARKGLKGGSKFENGDTLFARITPCLENGKICQVKNLENNLGFGSTEFLVFRGKKDISDTDFVYYLTKTDYVRNNAVQMMTGTSGRQRVEKSALENLEILAPDLPTQTQIASILTSFDDKIELLGQMNQTLETMAQTIFKEWFVDFNFPGFDGELVDGVPKGWKVLDLGCISTLIAGGDKPKNTSLQQNEQYKVPIYSNGITNEGLYGFTDTSRIFEESVTVSARGTIGYVCLRLKPYVPIVRLIGVIPKQEFVSAKYLYFWLKTQNISGTGTTQQQLTIPDFQRFKILVPHMELINQFTLIMNSFFNKIEKNKIQIRTLAHLRDALLPKLMSGKVKINTDVSHYDVRNS